MAVFASEREFGGNRANDWLAAQSETTGACQPSAGNTD